MYNKTAGIRKYVVAIIIIASVLSVLLLNGCGGKSSNDDEATRIAQDKATMEALATNIAQEKIKSSDSTPMPTVLPKTTPTPTTNAVEQDKEEPSIVNPAYDSNITSKVSLLPYEIMRLGRGKLNDISYSPTGSLLAASTINGIWLYDTNSYDSRLLTTYPADSIAWSPNGEEIAFVSTEYQIRIMAVGKEQLTKTIANELDPESWQDITEIAWSPDGTFLIAGGYKVLNVWNVRTGELIYKLDHIVESYRVSSLAWSPTGGVVAIGIMVNDDSSSGLGEQIMLLDIKTRTTNTLPRSSKGWISLTWSPNGTYLAGATEDEEVYVWSIADGELIQKLPGYQGHPIASWSPDGEWLATSFDNTLIIWATDEWKVKQTLDAQLNSIKGLSWKPDGMDLASGTSVGIKVWDSNNWKMLNMLGGFSDTITSVDWSTDGLLAAGSHDKLIRIWDTSDGRQVQTLRGHSDWVYSVAWSLDGSRLASGAQDGTARIWNVAKGTDDLTLDLSDVQSVNSVSWSPDDMWLATFGGYIWDTNNGSLVSVLDDAYYLIWSPDGTKLADLSHIWNSQTGELIANLEDTSQTWQLSWSPDGTMIAAGDINGYVYIFNSVTGRIIQRLDGRQYGSNGVYSVAWSPDGSLLACGTEEEIGMIMIWDTKTWELLESIRLPMEWMWVYSLSWSPDGNKLASALDDGVHIWDMSAFVTR